MAAMGAGEQSIQRQVFEVRRPSQRTAWALWIVVSVIGGVLAALAAWQIRTFFIRGPAFISQDARYVGTVVEALILGGAQWLVLRRYRLAVDWWVPVLVAANLLNVIVVIPSVLRLHDGAGVISPATAMIGGASALAAAGLVVGTCQALILRGSAGNVAWAWVPATIIGGALAGAVTTAVSVQLFGLPYGAFLSVLTATGTLLTAASQAPVLLRLLR
ncbi:MAG: hypothetical protein QOH92_2694 [Chloroflexota bacterium]|jgi:hypothetical protein|nr:hypothetical protein [Chloroflexota bacterium]